MDIGERIKLRRKELGYSLQEAGDLVGSTGSTFRKWEAGEISNMGIDKVQKVARALNVTPEYLMGWEDKEAGIDLPKDILNKAKALYEDPQCKILLDVKDKLSPKNLDTLLRMAEILMVMEEEDK